MPWKCCCLNWRTHETRTQKQKCKQLYNKFVYDGASHSRHKIIVGNKKKKWVIHQASVQLFTHHIIRFWESEIAARWYLRARAFIYSLKQFNIGVCVQWVELRMRCFKSSSSTNQALLGRQYTISVRMDAYQYRPLAQQTHTEYRAIVWASERNRVCVHTLARSCCCPASHLFRVHQASPLGTMYLACLTTRYLAQKFPKKKWNKSNKICCFQLLMLAMLYLRMGPV